MKFLKAAAFAMGAFVLSLATSGAKAETVQITVVDGVNTATFDVADSPTPSLATSNLFQLDDVQVDITSNGYKTGVTENIDFYATTGNTEFIADAEGWFADTLGNIEETGAYFTGSTSDPTFVAGTYGSAGDGVTITDISATPLPSTWTMMIAGLCGFAFVAFRATKTASAGLARA